MAKTALPALFRKVFQHWERHGAGTLLQDLIGRLVPGDRLLQTLQNQLGWAYDHFAAVLGANLIMFWDCTAVDKGQCRLTGFCRNACMAVAATARFANRMWAD